MNIQEFENYHEIKTFEEDVFPFNTYLCSIPLDFLSVPLHWQDDFELIYIKKGRGIVSVDFTDYPVFAGDLLPIMPGQLHSINRYENESMEYENIMISPKLFEGAKADSTMEDFITPILDGRIAIPHVFSSSDAKYKTFLDPIDKIDEIRRTMPKGHELYLKGQLYLFFFMLYSTYKKESAPSSAKKSLQRMKQILKFVELNYSEKICIATVSDEVGLSESHFMKYFKETMGVSFIEYLKSYRLKMAARLLKCSDDSILAVAESVGFDNLSYFNRAFKKKYGVTPSGFRKS